MSNAPSAGASSGKALLLVEERDPAVALVGEGAVDKPYLIRKDKNGKGGNGMDLEKVAKQLAEAGLENEEDVLAILKEKVKDEEAAQSLEAAMRLIHVSKSKIPEEAMTAVFELTGLKLPAEQPIEKEKEQMADKEKTNEVKVDKEKVLAELTPEAKALFDNQQAQLASIQKSNEKLQASLDEEKEARVTKEFEAKVNDFPHLVSDDLKPQLAKVLKSAHSGMDSDTYGHLTTLLTNCNTSIGELKKAKEDLDKVTKEKDELQEKIEKVKPAASAAEGDGDPDKVKKEKGEGEEEKVDKGFWGGKFL